jgi:Polyketide cyclase / dehydrase and lipid transport
MPGVGDGRRMPVQQAVDVAVPLETAYNQWTQFEDWPNFMHRVTRVSQEDDCTVSFASKIWGKTKEFVAEIETQRPDERIRWKVTQGITHTGVVTFHELAPRLTRIEVSLDVDPGSLLEKAARGMRHIKRAVRGDLHRFKAFIELQEIETGAWRGVIEDGELVEEHDESYDEQREYSEPGELFAATGDDDEEQEDDEDSRRASPQRSTRQAQRSRSGGSSGGRSRSGSSSSGSRRSSSGSSKAKASNSSRSSGRSRSSSNGSRASNGGSSKRSKSSGGGASKRKASGRS